MSFKILLVGVGLASALFACGGSSDDGNETPQSAQGAAGGGAGGAGGGAGAAGGGAAGTAGAGSAGSSGAGSGGTGAANTGGTGLGGASGAGAAGKGGQAAGGSAGGKPAASDAEIAALCDDLCKALDVKNAEVGCTPATSCSSSCAPTVSAFFASCVPEYASMVDCAKKQPASAFMCDPKMGAQLNDGVCKAETDKLEACAGF